MAAIIARERRRREKEREWWITRQGEPWKQDPEEGEKEEGSGDDEEEELDAQIPEPDSEGGGGTGKKKEKEDLSLNWVRGGYDSRLLSSPAGHLDAYEAGRDACPPEDCAQPHSSARPPPAAALPQVQAAVRMATGEMRPTDFLYEEYNVERERRDWGENILELVEGYMDEDEDEEDDADEEGGCG